MKRIVYKKDLPIKAIKLSRKEVDHILGGWWWACNNEIPRAFGVSPNIGTGKYMSGFSNSEYHAVNEGQQKMKFIFP